MRRYRDLRPAITALCLPPGIDDALVIELLEAAHGPRRAAVVSVAVDRTIVSDSVRGRGGRLCEPRSHFLDQPADVFDLDQSDRFRGTMVEIAGNCEVAIAEMQFEAGRVIGARPFLEVSAPLGPGYAPDFVEIIIPVQEVDFDALS